MALSIREQQLIDGVIPRLRIGDRWQDASDGASFGVEDPSTGELLCQVSDATEADAKDALDAACAAQEDWAAHPPRQRGEILRRTWQLLTDRVEDLALLMTLEMGKP